jgi:hypothetical protein
LEKRRTFVSQNLNSINLNNCFPNKKENQPTTFLYRKSSIQLGTRGSLTQFLQVIIMFRYGNVPHPK